MAKSVHKHIEPELPVENKQEVIKAEINSTTLFFQFITIEL